MMPRSKSLFIAASVMPVISFGWLKCVWSTTSLWSFRPFSTIARERVDPRVVGEDLLRHDRRALGREAHAADVRHREERLADLLDAAARGAGTRRRREMTMSSSSGRDAMYCEGALPALVVGLEVHLLDLFGVDADRVAARAEAAVDGARVEREKERLVGVAVREPGDGRVVLLVERVEVELRVIGQKARGERDELDAERVVVRVAPSR